MSTALVLVAAGLVSWLLRVLFIALVPASRLPAPVRDALRHAAPAALAALLATSLARPTAATATLPILLALLAGGAVAWRTQRVLAPTGTAIAVFALLTL